MKTDFEAKEKEAKGAAIDLSGMRVLLVEDCGLNLEIAQMILTESGAVVATAQNGRIAVEVFEKSRQGAFDAILMDIMMPVMDGLEATRAIRAMDRPDAGTVPILAMTASAYEEDIQRAREAGMNAHLLKPIDPRAMLRALEGFYAKRGPGEEGPPGR